MRSSDAECFGVAIVTDDFLQDLRADAKHFKRLGEIVTSCLESYFCSDPAAADEHLSAATDVIEACTPRSRLCLLDLRDAVSALRDRSKDLLARDRECCLSCLLGWLQRPGATIEVSLKSLRYCAATQKKVELPRLDVGQADPWSFKWVVDVVTYDSLYWALDGQCLAALFRAEDAISKSPYFGHVRVRIWPLNTVVKFFKGHDDDDHTLAAFVRLVTEEASLQREQGDAALIPRVPAAVVSDSSPNRSRSRSPKKTHAHGDLDDNRQERLQKPGSAVASPSATSSTSKSPNPKPSPTKPQAADPSKESAFPKEVRKALAASDALALVNSNASGGVLAYHGARLPLEEAARQLDEPLKALVEERLAHMQKTFKANTAKTYRSVCQEIRELLVKRAGEQAQKRLFAD